MLELMDGFDSYTNYNDLNIYGWINNFGTTGISTGRFPGSKAVAPTSGPGLAYNPYSYLPSGSLPSRTIGFAFYFGGGGTPGPLISLWDGFTPQFALSYSAASANLYVQLGAGYGPDSTPIPGGICAGIYPPGYWYQVEVNYIIAGSSSSIEVRSNRNTILNLTGVNLQSSTNATANILSLGGCWPGTLLIDDSYVVNPIGAAPTTFLGETRVVYAAPTADSVLNTGFAPSTGTSAFALINGNSPSTNTAYVSTSTIGATSTFSFPTLPAFTGNITALRLKAAVKQDDALSHTVAAVFAHGGTNYVSAQVSETNSSYIGTNSMFLTNPATSAPFTQNDITANEFGVTLVS